MTPERRPQTVFLWCLCALSLFLLTSLHSFLDVVEKSVVFEVAIDNYIMILSYYNIIASTSSYLIILSYRHIIIDAYRVATIAPMFKNMWKTI